MASSQTLNIEGNFEATTQKCITDYKSCEAELKVTIEAALRNPYFLAKRTNDSTISYEKISKVRQDLFRLLFNILVLSPAIRTPGLVGLYLEAILRRIVSYAHTNSDVQLVTRILARVQVDLVRLEVILTLLSTSQASLS
jgi:hypothetical protein